MGLAEQRQKDQATAAYMKEKGIKRTTGQCPVCHKPYNLNAHGLAGHFAHRCGK